MNIKEVLGECYLDLSDTRLTKLEYVDAINKFINKYNTYYPEYSTVDNEPKITDMMKIFVKDNEMIILNYNFFIRKINRTLLSNPLESRCRYHDFIIARDKYGVNKVIVSRAYGTPYALSTRLSKGTLNAFYKMLVLDIVDLKSHNRFLKELDIFIKDNIINKYTLKCKSQYVTVTKYSDFKYNEKNFTLTISAKLFSSPNFDALDFSNEKSICERELSFSGMDRISSFFESIKSLNLLSTKEELAKAYDSYYNNINHNINDTKKFLLSDIF